MKTHPHIHPLARLFCALLALVSLTTPSFAQQMPQDHWQSYGLQFTGPAPNATLNAIAIGPGGVYVGENNGGSAYTSVLQFNQGGVFVQRFTVTFGNVAGLACDPSGNVYCLDTVNSTVNVFDPNGTFLRSWGASGTANGQFGSFPFTYSSMIAVDKNSQVYVCDPGNSRVQVFDTNGNFLRKWGQQGSLPAQFGNSYPQAIAVSLDGSVYVNGQGQLVTAFDSNGNYVAALSSFAGVFYGNPLIATGLCVSPDGLLLVPNVYNCSLYDRGLNPVTTFFLNSPVVGTYAISSRGDIYSVAGNTVTVYERQYSNVQNSLSPPAIPLPIVLDAAQRSNTSWMDIDYQVTDADSPTVATGVLAFMNGGTTLNEAVLMSTFMEGTGANLGLNQPTGTSLHLTWNMAADWTVDYSQVQVEALAKDSRNLLGFQWITVPASGSNPSIQVSAASVSDTVLLDLWFWLLATQPAGLSLSNGTITGTADPYNGVVLATTTGAFPNDVSTSTAAGRQYLYGLLNVRAIAPAEITQAQGGNYGFTSVDTNSVVKLP